MGLQPDIIAKLLIEELFSKSNYTKCGPSNASRAYHFKLKDATSYDKDLKYIIPDIGFHPKIMVTIDFTHQFVISEKDTEGQKIKGRRPVDKYTLQRVVDNLLVFYSYYFEYVLSYNKSYQRSKLKSIIDKARNMDEHAMNIFVNQILNFFITNVQTNRARTDIGNATITFRDTPNYRLEEGKDNLFFEKAYDILNQIFVPMLPITVWARGRLYKDWWFPIFDGFTVATTIANTEGFFTVTLACKDLLELARISYEMINPAIIPVEEIKTQKTVNIYSKPLYRHDHFQIFRTMFLGGNLKWNPDTLDLSIQADPTDPDTHKFSALGNFDEINEKSKIKPENLSDQFKGLYARTPNKFSLERGLQYTSHKNRKRKIIYWGYSMTPYRLFNFQSPQIFTADFESRLDVLRDISAMCYYELYVDAWGNVNYHPMRFGNYHLKQDILFIDTEGKIRLHNNTFPFSQVIGKEEILNSSNVLNIEELVTFIRMSGIDAVLSSQQPELIELVEGYVDKGLMERFGYRRREVQNAMFNYNVNIPDKNGKKGKFLKLVGRELLNYMNGELYTHQSTIVFRPELELASPLLVLPEENVFYINNISHSITIGGEATTTINASFGRKIDQPALDLAYYMAQSEKLFVVNGDTGDFEIEGDEIQAIPMEEHEKMLEKWRQQYDESIEKKNEQTQSKKEAKSARRKKSNTNRASTKESRDAAARKIKQDLLSKFPDSWTKGTEITVEVD